MRGYGEPEFKPICCNGRDLEWSVEGSEPAPGGAISHLPVSSGGQARAVGGGGCRVGSAGWCRWGSGMVSHRVPEPLELMLPVVVLADAHVAQGSIGTPVVSISACFPLFSNASVSDGSSR